MEQLSDAQVLLLAAQLVATPDFPKLRSLAANRPDVLPSPLLYRLLLTYLPLDTDPEIEQHLTTFLQNVHDQFADFSNLDSNLHEDDLVDLGRVDAEQALSSLRLEKVPVYDASQDQDLLSDFIIAWLHKLERFSGLPASVLALVDCFVAQYSILRYWADSYLRPLLRLRDEYNPDTTASLSLQDLETASGEPGVNFLLQFATRTGTSDNVSRDLRDVVSPWVRGAKSSKRRRISAPGKEQLLQQGTNWNDVNEWLVSTSRTNYDLIAATFQKWNGPPPENGSSDVTALDEGDKDAMLAYIKTAFALVYISDETGDDDHRITHKQAILGRAAQLAQLMPPSFETALPDIPDLSHMQNATRSDLLENALLSSNNQLTNPSTDNIDFLHGVLSTQVLLNTFKLKNSTRSVASTALFESEEKQKQELRTILNQIPRLTRSNFPWPEIRARLRWLQSWSTHESVSASPSPTAFFGRVAVEFLELEIVNAILAANDYQTLRDIYLSTEQSVLPRSKIQEHVTAAILGAYDNASNGNRTRGGVKRASDLIKAFKSSLDDTAEFEHLEYLIKATHSLSFYQLTLQHGVPFQPVSIRVSNDPLSLIEKVLDQNNKAYTKLDDLLGIARNLVLADLPIPMTQDFAPGEPIPLDRRLFEAEHRVTYSAIKAALADNDFDTAYSLITTRLAISPNQNSNTNFTDDTSWRAAYSAGKYRPTTSSPNIHAQISSLQKRMDLLSTALTLAPTSDPLPEILSTWRRCEEELDNLKSQALQEERAHDAASDQVLPGAFGLSDRDLDANETRRLLESRRAYNSTTSGPSYEEEAPMGLFDVARGAASALRKNAFPLGGAQRQTGKVRDTAPVTGRQSMDGSMRSSGEGERPDSSDGQQRVRKRDMLSNAVTGGLVSGMSWVLGAPPSNRQQGQE